MFESLLDSDGEVIAIAPPLQKRHHTRSYEDQSAEETDNGPSQASDEASPNSTNSDSDDGLRLNAAPSQKARKRRKKAYEDSAFNPRRTQSGAGSFFASYFRGGLKPHKVDIRLSQDSDEVKPSPMSCNVDDVAVIPMNCNVDVAADMPRTPERDKAKAILRAVSDKDKTGNLTERLVGVEQNPCIVTPERGPKHAAFYSSTGSPLVALKTPQKQTRLPLVYAFGKLRIHADPQQPAYEHCIPKTLSAQVAKLKQFDFVRASKVVAVLTYEMTQQVKRVFIANGSRRIPSQSRAISATNEDLTAYELATAYGLDPIPYHQKEQPEIGGFHWELTHKIPYRHLGDAAQTIDNLYLAPANHNSKCIPVEYAIDRLQEIKFNEFEQDITAFLKKCDRSVTRDPLMQAFLSETGFIYDEIKVQVDTEYLNYYRVNYIEKGIAKTQDFNTKLEAQFFIESSKQVKSSVIAPMPTLLAKRIDYKIKAISKRFPNLNVEFNTALEPLNPNPSCDVLHNLVGKYIHQEIVARLKASLSQYRKPQPIVGQGYATRQLLFKQRQELFANLPGLSLAPPNSKVSPPTLLSLLPPQKK